jgi:glycerophosphoryl diester phosphodiesterase
MKGSSGITTALSARHFINIADLAKVVTGVGPALGAVLGKAGQVTPLVQLVRAAGLKLHPYTFLKEELPHWAANSQQLHTALRDLAKVDGLFTDFPDLSLRELQQ